MLTCFTKEKPMSVKLKISPYFKMQISQQNCLKSKSCCQCDEHTSGGFSANMSLQ